MYSLFGIFDMDNFLNMEKFLVSLCDFFAGKLFTTLDAKLGYTKEMAVGQNAFKLTYIFQLGWNHHPEKRTSRKQKALTSAPVWCHVSQWRERPLGMKDEGTMNGQTIPVWIFGSFGKTWNHPKIMNGHRELPNMSVFIRRLVCKKMVKCLRVVLPCDCNGQKAKLSYFSDGNYEKKTRNPETDLKHKLDLPPYHPHPIPGTWRYQVLLGIPEPKDTSFSWWWRASILMDVWKMKIPQLHLSFKSV